MPSLTTWQTTWLQPHALFLGNKNATPSSFRLFIFFISLNTKQNFLSLFNWKQHIWLINNLALTNLFSTFKDFLRGSRLLERLVNRSKNISAHLNDHFYLRMITKSTLNKLQLHFDETVVFQSHFVSNLTKG